MTIDKKGYNNLRAASWLVFGIMAFSLYINHAHGDAIIECLVMPVCEVAK